MLKIVHKNEITFTVVILELFLRFAIFLKFCLKSFCFSLRPKMVFFFLVNLMTNNWERGNPARPLEPRREQVSIP
jgi:hypothetical protein